MLPNWRKLRGWWAIVLVLALAPALAQPRRAQPPGDDQPPPPQGVSRGENFSAKPPAQLFASDCTGAGCHRGPQGLAKTSTSFGLASFLRQHYTNSQQSATALAQYLASLPAANQPAKKQPERKSKASAEPPDKKQPEPKSKASAEPPDAKSGDRKAARPPRGRQATAEQPAPAPAAAAPAAAPAAPAAPASDTPPVAETPAPPTPPAPPPAPKVWDIFD